MRWRLALANLVSVKTNLESPTGPKLKRKASAEPTMTLHTKAANNDILDIFNQPLKNVQPITSHADSAGESDYEDDDYTSAGESTGTGRISGTSEFGDDERDSRSVADPEETNAESVSPWSDFTRSKHVPNLNIIEDANSESTVDGFVVLEDVAADEEKDEGVVDVVTPTSPVYRDGQPRPKYVPLPPEDYEPPMRPYRDPVQVSQNRLPFMTPIVEKTESSMGALTIREEKDYFNSKTPSRRHGDGSVINEFEDEPLSSPFEEIINEARTNRSKVKGPKQSEPGTSKIGHTSTQESVAKRKAKGPIIKDTQCNPVDDSIRQSILDNLEVPLSHYSGYHDYRSQAFNKTPEIRKYIKALAKASSKTSSDKTTTSLSLPPTLQFPSTPSQTYTIKREIGKGAFAPVYLAQISKEDDAADLQSPLVAMKCEEPPTSWEFYIMSTLHSRLSLSNHRATTSVLIPYSLHLFTDEVYLLEAYRDQGTLLDLVNSAKTTPAGVLDECVAMFFAIELLRTMEAMHDVGILHGDLKADNCLVRLSPLPNSEELDTQYHANGSNGWSHKGLTLIDFGRGIDMRAFRPDVKFVADWKTGKADCAEMRAMRPWTYQVDYWGTAGVIHSLLFGKYIEDVCVDAPSRKDGEDAGGLGLGIGLGEQAIGGKRHKLKEPLKRYWQTALWNNLFDTLLNPLMFVEGEEGGRMPVRKRLGLVRGEMEGWLEGEGGRRGVRGLVRRCEEWMGGKKGR